MGGCDEIDPDRSVGCSRSRFFDQALAGQKGGSQSKSNPSTTTSTTSTTVPSSATSASAIATCGIKPPPPVGFWPDDAVCLCDGKKGK